MYKVQLLRNLQRAAVSLSFKSLSNGFREVDSSFKMYAKYGEFIQSSQVQKKSLLFVVIRPKVITKEDSPIFIVLTL